MSGMFIDLMDLTKLRKLCEWNCATECIVNNYFLQYMLKDVHLQSETFSVDFCYICKFNCICVCY